MRWMTIMLVCLAACVGGGHRYYDNDHGDYHVWNGTEVTFYTRWEGETHRQHVDFERRNGEEQREYWNWRHSHDRDDHH